MSQNYGSNFWDRTLARRVFSYWAVCELCETATPIAKRAGILQSEVSMSVDRGEKIVDELRFELKRILTYELVNVL